jgi:hypothetical protein
MCRFQISNVQMNRDLRIWQFEDLKMILDLKFKSSN